MTTDLTNADGTPAEELPTTTADDNATPAADSDADAPETPEQDAEATEDGETFPRAYVERLRAESARYRDRAKAADGLAQRLHTALVEATGRLADASDLEFDAAHLDDPEALTAAVDDLLAAKPHLANRTPRGSVGQGAVPSGDGSAVSLLGMMRPNA
ncbi:hypothetical protein GCM10010977_02530 [Citricoccus zhacaiensis]|uniref:Scaffolding protein n=2 Tax=Citricoccus zhacaiensis TaxID=489142 RepID=A0ABQ2LMJ3_9MICC|nr:hypothetical protein GCM10010977_02530 [Citricoccus zhacaiensis]